MDNNALEALSLKINEKHVPRYCLICLSVEPAKSNVTVYNRTANKLNMPAALNIEDSGLVLTYDPLVQEFLLSGTATATKDISLNATFNALSGDRFSIKRLYQSGDITSAGGTLPRLKLVNSGGGSYYHYLKAQVEVAKEYGIPIVDLYHNLPNTKPTFYSTYMLNDTHFSAVGNDWVAELVARELIGNGNKGDMDVIPPIPTTDGTYTLKVTITGGIPVFSWVA